MYDQQQADLVAEVNRLRAENERLTRLVATQRPELTDLRQLEVKLRDYLTNAVPRVQEMHALATRLLGGTDDLPTIEELSGMWGSVPGGDPQEP